MSNINTKLVLACEFQFNQIHYSSRPRFPLAPVNPGVKPWKTDCDAMAAVTVTRDPKAGIFQFASNTSADAITGLQSDAVSCI